MLQLVLGRSGTGKTTYIQHALAAAAKEGKRAIFLVPEQASFETERGVYSMLPPNLAMGVEVLSFTRLCESIFRQYGGIEGKQADAATRLIFMHLALDEMRDQLQIYKNLGSGTTALNTLLTTVAQFRHGAITPQALQDAAQAIAPHKPRLAAKLQELGLVYAAYQALLERSFQDSTDNLQQAATLATQHGFFKEYSIYIDGFMSFTAAEKLLLHNMIETAPNVLCSFCCDGSINQNRSDLFATSAKTAAQLTQYAHSHGTAVSAPIHLTKPLRYKAQGLAGVEELLAGAQECTGHTGVQLLQAQTPYHEVEAIAPQIAALVRQQGLRYKDIVVIARNPEDYAAAIDTAFARYDIPYFYSRPLQVQTQPVPVALLLALEAASQQYSTDTLLKLAKCPTLGLDALAVSALENYCYVWSVKGSAFTAQLVNNPRGLGNQFTPEDTAQLAQINQVRAALMAPLQALTAALQSCTGHGFATALYKYLQDINCQQHIQAFITAMPPQAQSQETTQHSAIWAEIMNLLDAFATGLEHKYLPAKKLAELFALSVEAIDFTPIPPMIDQVMIGAANLVRPNQPKAVFLLGVNEGVFPAQVTNPSVFSDDECATLKEAGLEIGADNIARTLEEEYFFYRAATCGQQQLCIAYSVAEATGKPRNPALPFTRLVQAMPGAVASAPLIQHRIVNLETAKEAFAQQYIHGGSLAKTLEEFLRQNGCDDFINRVVALHNFGGIGDIRPQTAQQLFGQDMHLSPSRCEGYYICPFQYFCKYGLKALPLRKADFSLMESGNIAHYVLETMLKRHSGAALAGMGQKQMRTEIAQIIAEYIATMAVEQNALGARTKYLFARLVGILARVLARLGAELMQSKFVPMGFEIELGDNSTIAPLRLESPLGASITLSGKIDRADLYQGKNGKYARVVDYKSGGKKFTLSDIYYGLNMQMLIYLFALCQNGEGQLEGAQPAGILYMPAGVAVISMPRDSQADAVEKKHGDKLKMSGLVLDDHEVLRAMEAELSGQFIPAAQKADGTMDARVTSASSLDEFAKLKTYVLRAVQKMADGLLSGAITPCPAMGTDYNPCAYCDYKPLCRIELTGAQRDIKPLSRQQLFTAMQQDEEGQVSSHE